MEKQVEILILVLTAILMALLTKTDAKPTLGFSLSESFPNFPSFTSITKSLIDKRSASQMKTYSGQRISNDSLVMVYYHDATIAVVELGPQKLLLNCELIEIYTENGGKSLLENLSQINRPLEISFEEMVKLMNQCERVDKINEKFKNREKVATESTTTSAQETFKKNPISIFSGILPGTKWCGTGDIAETYHDLGPDSADRCCRMHDLCPVKVRGLQMKFDLTNDAVYSKSHCVCDDTLFSCLREANSSSSQLLGNIYFNLIRMPCLEGNGEGIRFRNAREGF